MSIEKRSNERLSLNLTGQVGVLDPSGNATVYETKTRDVSSSGAFLLMDKKIEVNTRVQLELELALDQLKTMKGSKTRVRLMGSVVRILEDGVGISFDADYKFIACDGK